MGAGTNVDQVVRLCMRILSVLSVQDEILELSTLLEEGLDGSAVELPPSKRNAIVERKTRFIVAGKYGSPLSLLVLYILGASIALVLTLPPTP